MTVSDRVRDIVAPLFADGAVELVDVEHTGPALRVIIDRPGGLDLEAVTAMSRTISRLLDAEDPLSSRYTLEVSTPGLERPLRLPEHFRRAVGADVHVKTRPDVPGERRITGVLVDADDDGIVVALDGDPGSPEPAEVPDGAPPGRRRLGYAEIERARTVFQWGPAPKPGKGSRPGAPRPATASKPLSQKPKTTKKTKKAATP